jgi:hypothetical protein
MTAAEEIAMATAMTTVMGTVTTTRWQDNSNEGKDDNNKGGNSNSSGSSISAGGGHGNVGWLLFFAVGCLAFTCLRNHTNIPANKFILV